MDFGRNEILLALWRHYFLRSAIFTHKLRFFMQNIYLNWPKTISSSRPESLKNEKITPPQKGQIHITH